MQQLEHSNIILVGFAVPLLAQVYPISGMSRWIGGFSKNRAQINF